MDDHLRAADRDREDVVAILREQYAQGRLTLEEFDDRTTAAYNARTIGDLRPLVADLPAAPPGPYGAQPGRAPWPRGRMTLVAVAGVLLVAAVMVAAVTAGHAFFAAPSWIVALVVLKLVRGRRSCHPGELRDTAAVRDDC